MSCNGWHADKLDLIEPAQNINALHSLHKLGIPQFKKRWPFLLHVTKAPHSASLPPRPFPPSTSLDRPQFST